MERYKKILVPLDGSQTAEAILPEIEKVAAVSGTHVSLLQVVSAHLVPYAPYSNPGEFREALIEDAENYLAGLEERFGNQEFTVESFVLVGDEANSILDYATENNVDLIAMSTHGRSGVERWLLGSVAEKVLRHATQPILLIRAPVGGTEIKPQTSI